MCKASHEPGGPRRCSADARQRLHHVSDQVARLDHRRGELLKARWAQLTRAGFSYPDVGASAGGEFPSGYRHIRRELRVGTGRPCFLACAEKVMNWQMHRNAGIRFESSMPTAEPGSLALVGVGPIMGGCRVVYVIDEPCRRGFAYGTLEGHPESGEEFFGVRFDPSDGAVVAEIAGFSRPGRWWVKAGDPLASLVQRTITDRYLRAVLP